MMLLPKHEWTFWRGDECLIVGAHEHEGYLWHTRFALADLPNDLLGPADLKRLGINPIDWRTVAEPEARKVLAD